MQNQDMLMDVAHQCRIFKRHFNTLKRLQVSTHFNDEELKALLILYFKLTVDKQMDTKWFRHVLHVTFDMTSDIITDSIFSVLDIHKTTHLDFERFAHGMSIMLRGTEEEHIRFCFDVYDFNRIGVLTREVMLGLMKNSLFSAVDDADEIVKELVDVILKKLDIDRDGKVSFQDFHDSVKKNPNLVEALGECLPSRGRIHTFTSSLCRHVAGY